MKVCIPLLIYLAIQSITPGPNNLTCLFLGGAYGISGTRKFLTASMFCLFVKSFLCGSLNILLADVLPSVVAWLKWFGAAYMLYLAWQFGKSGWVLESDVALENKIASYKDGVLLQLFNTKSWIASLSAFAVYVIPISTRITTVLWISAAFFAMALASSLIWAIFGSSFKSFIASHRKAFGLIMGLSLVYCAVSAML